MGEDDLSDGSGFENDYERTKFEAEQLARDAMAGLPITVARPAMIVGDSRTGEIATFNTFYVLLRRYLTRRTYAMPAAPPAGERRAGRLRRRCDRATADGSRAEGRTVHLTGPVVVAPDGSRSHP